jgi:hypothetical protein
MSAQYLNTDFVKKYRQGFIAYPAIGEYQYENLLLRQIAGNNSELPLLGKSLSEKLHSDRIIGQIMAKLEIEDIPNSRRLFKFVQAVNRSGKAWVQKGAYTTGYYKGLITAMNNFSELARAFQEDLRENFSCNLKKLFTNPAPGVYDYIDCSFTSELLDTIEYYLVNMQMYYDYFNISFQREAANSKGIPVTTPMPGNLLKLTALIKMVIDDFMHTYQMVITWEEQIENLEEQVMYN